MIIQSGKRAGRSTESLLIKQPDFAQWMMGTHPDNKISVDFQRLKKIFDKKQLCTECYGCKKPATFATAYQDTPDLYYWCDNCKPYSSGARSGTLTKINSFDAAMHHVDMTGGGNRGDKRKIIRELADAKGLVGRLTEKLLSQFFC